MPADFVRRTIHRARKHYRCLHCGRSISPGDRYRRSAGRFDALNGEMATHRACANCAGLNDEGERSRGE